MNINDVGYNVTIGEPVVDAKGVADSGLSFPCKAIPDGDYLVTLEVNGTVIAGRDKATFASGSATVGDYTLSYSSYAVSVATLTDDDVVVLRIEPLDVKVSDAFRAVVGKAAPAGGGSGGGAAEDEPLINEKVVYTQVLGDPTSEGSGMLKTYYYELDDGIEDYLEYDEDTTQYVPKQNCSYTIGGFGNQNGSFVMKDDKYYYTVLVSQIAGNRTFVMTETTFSPALINLYDPDSEDTENYYPDGAYDSDEEAFVLDVSAAYERLKRGQPVWIRYFSNDQVRMEMILTFREDNDYLYVWTWWLEGIAFQNYKGTSDDSGTENDQPPVSPVNPNNPI